MTELAILRYALAGWTMKPDVPDGGRAFSMHKEGGIALIFGLFAAITVIEAACVHFVVQRWSVKAAWILFALSIYGAILLIALARSFALRPIVVSNDSVLIRSGLLWSATVTPENIQRVDLSANGSAYHRITGMCEPNLFLDLHQNITVEGLYGRRKSVRGIAISADQPHELKQAICSLMAR